MSAPIARIAPGNSIQPEETPSSSHAEQSRTFLALARGRLARRGGIAIHAKMLHLPHTERDMDKKNKNADVPPPFRPRSQDRDPHGDHREPPGEDPGGYYGQRALHGHQEVEGWQGWVRVLPVGAVACHSPPHLRKSRPGPKIDTSTTFFFTPVIGSDNGGFTRYGCAVAKKCGRLFSTVQTPTGANTSQQGDSGFWGDRFFSLPLLHRG